MSSARRPSPGSRCSARSGWTRCSRDGREELRADAVRARPADPRRRPRRRTCSSARATGVRRVDARPGRRAAGAAGERGPRRTPATTWRSWCRATRRGRLLRRPGRGVGRAAGGPRRGAVPLAGGPGPAAGPGRGGRRVRARSRSGGGRGVRPCATGRAGGPFRRVGDRDGGSASPIVMPNAPVLRRPDPAVEEAQARARGGGGRRIWWSRRPAPGFCGAVVRCEAGHGDPGGPLRQAPGVPAGAARLPAGGPGGDPGPPVRRGARTSRAHGLRFGRRARGAGAGGAGRADLRGGPARRGAGRTGLGRRPADRGRRRGVPGGRRRPARDRRRLRPGPGRPPRRPRRPPGARLEGVPDRGVGHRRRTCWSSATPTSTSGRP